jgi:hypothetical protein
MVSPGLGFFSRRRISWRTSLAALVAITALFSFLMFQLGRRGYDEVATTHTIALARPIDGQTWSVKSYSNVFVTRGDTYAITHSGGEGAYSTAQSLEAVRGLIHNGQDAGLVADVPLFSTRSFVFHGPIEAPGIQVELEAWPDDIRQLVMHVDESFPADAADIRLVYKRHVHVVVREGDELRVGGGLETIEHALGLDNPYQYGYYGPGYYYYDDGASAPVAEKVFADLWSAIAAEALGVRQASAAQDLTAQDEALLLIYVPLPEAMHVRGENLPGEVGRVLYVITLSAEDANPGGGH